MSSAGGISTLGVGVGVVGELRDAGATVANGAIATGWRLGWLREDIEASLSPTTFERET